MMGSSPDTIYNQPRALLAALGSFWAQLYEGNDQLLSFSAAKCSVETQTEIDFFELLQSLSRYTTPIYHKDRWRQIRLRQSALQRIDLNIAKYGDNRYYDDGLIYDAATPQPWFRFELPAALVDLGILLNRFTDPSLIWTSPADFRLEAGTLLLRVNPFEDTRVAKRPIFKDGVVVDYEVVLWAFNAQEDWDTLYQQYGYVIGMRLASSAGYRELLNAYFDALVGGMTEQQYRLALSAMTGIPLVREREELVQDIVVSDDELLIITDQHVYKHHQDAAPTVAIGDTLYRGDAMTSALQFWSFNRGVVPAELTALALGRGRLASCFYSDLVFVNKQVPLVVDSSHPSGYTHVSFQLGGLPQDVQKFFDDLHARGVAAAEQPVDACAPGDVYYVLDDSNCDSPPARVPRRRGTLAHLLDLRADRVGEPTVASLPSTINPLELLVKHVFRGAGCAVKVQTNRLGTNALGLFNTRLLQKVLPPQIAVFLIIELTPAADSVATSLISTDTVSMIPGMEPGVTSVNNNMIRADRVRLRAVSGRCL